MDVRDLELFSAIATEGGFTKAATKLFLSRTAISRKIRLLEEELGQQLLVRAGRRVTLTPAGKSLLQHSQIVRRYMRAIRDEFSGSAALQHGQLSIGAYFTDCFQTLPHVLKKFRQTFPGLELTITVGSLEELVPQIKNGTIDLCLLTDPPVDSGLTIINLYSEELVVAVGLAHPWAKRRRIGVAELANFPFISLTRNTRSGQILEATFRELGVKVRTIMELPNSLVIGPLVEANLGFSILPISLVGNPKHRIRLHTLRIREKRIYRKRVLVHLKSAHLPRAVTEMVRLLKLDLQQV